MAASTAAKTLIRRLCDPHDRRISLVVGCLLLVGETLLTVAIILKVAYTEIDWIAYMQEVGGFLSGERDYAKLRGDTGPLVYPAGFVYLFAALKELTQEQIFPAQCIFAVVYLASQAVVLAMYRESEVVPPWALVLLTLSKRMHSLYVLRLFNDCWAMLLAWMALLLLCHRRWAPAIVVFSAAVSIKMNVLLMAPPVLAVCLAAAPVAAVVWGVVLAVALQVALALPFLLEFPASYFHGAFEFSRVFQYKWTVNWKFLSEEVFLSPLFAKALLAAHLALLLAFMHRKWLARQGGLPFALATFLGSGARTAMAPGDVARIVCTGNFIGIAVARSLHYQFYSWYFHSIPLLLWSTALPTWAKLAVFAAIEWTWNVFPATPLSSGVLCACHALLLACLWFLREPALSSKKKV